MKIILYFCGLKTKKCWKHLISLGFQQKYQEDEEIAIFNHHYCGSFNA